MKKIVFSIFFSAIALGSYAQLTVKPHLGFNFSRLSTEPVNYESPSARPGGMLGIGFKFGESWYLEPGIQLTSMSWDMVHSTDQDLDYSPFINGIRVPFVGGYQFGSNDALVNFRVFAGLSAQFILDVDQPNISDEVPQPEDFTGTIWGANVGMGLDIWFLYLELGYDAGLSKYFQNTAKFGEGKNNMLWLTLGVNLGGN